jgi:RNA polymerase sigma-70 factor (ECF subfamily)
VSDVKQFKLQLVQLLPKLRRFACALTRNVDDADELVQMACERAILKSDQWTDGTRLDSWVYTMMRNLWFSELRKRKVRLGQGQVDAEDMTEHHSEPHAEDQVYANQVGRAIYALPEGLRSVTLLVCVEEHSYREAAEILDVPVGTIMSRLSRARLQLAESLRDRPELSAETV